MGSRGDSGNNKGSAKTIKRPKHYLNQKYQHKWMLLNQ